MDASEDVTWAVAQIREIVADAAKELRGVAHGLMPLDRKPGGLAKGLNRLAEQTTAMGAAVCEAEFPDGLLPVADAEVAHHLYRIAQEAVGNAVRHGGAKRVVVRLTKGGADRAVLAITDDGAGLPDPPAPDDPTPAAGTPAAAGGLAAGRHAVPRRSIGGRLWSRGPDAGGTRVVCEFPTPTPADPPAAAHAATAATAARPRPGGTVARAGAGGLNEWRA